MALPPKKKKGSAVGIELLLGPEGDEPEMGDEAEGDEMELDLAADDLEDEDALGEESDDMGGGELDDEEAAPTVDPEHAALAEKLGFTDPEQQQALVDLIQLVLDSGSAPAPGEDTGALPPLPEESVY